METTATDYTERVAQLLPGATPDEIKRGAELLAAFYCEPTVTFDAIGSTLAEWTFAPGEYDIEKLTWKGVPIAGPYEPATRDARAFDGRKSGGIVLTDILSTIPDAWSGQADVTPTRSRKGRATVRVNREHVAPVIGRWDTDSQGLPLLAMPHACSPDNMNAWSAAVHMAHAFNRGEVRRLRGGWSSLDVTREANRGLALADVPALLGRDGRGYAQVIRGDRASRSSVAVHRTDITGESVPSHLSRFVAPAAGYRPETRLSWQARTKLPAMRARTGESLAPATRDAVCRYFPGRAIPDCETGVLPASVQTCTVTALAAPTDSPDKRFDGHVTRERPTAVKRTTGKRKARTVGTVEPPTTTEAWELLAAMLNRGERLVAGAVTITRSKAGRFNATDKRGDEPVHWRGVRTTTALALKLTA